MCWICFLKAENDVFAEFQRFKAHVENQSSLKMKTLRSNNGTNVIQANLINYIKM